MLDFLRSKKKKSNHLVWKIVGGAAVAALAAGVIGGFNDIKRYVKMTMM